MSNMKAKKKTYVFIFTIVLGALVITAVKSRPQPGAGRVDAGVGVAGVGVQADTGVAEPVWLPIKPDVDVAYVPDHTSGPSITAAAAILFENTTGTVLYGREEHRPRAPASITKVMTALLALEQGRLSDTVTVSKKAASIRGSSAYLHTGQKILLEDLLYAMLLRSGNDAAYAVAEHIGGNIDNFLEMMNTRARELGAGRTHFANPHGLDAPGHYSTAFDLAMISRVALLYNKFAEIVGTIHYTYEEGGVVWKNTNRLLWSYAGTEGIKTGTTGQAGNCLAAAATRDGRQLITVVLGSRNRWNDSVKLLEYGFDRFRLVTVAKEGEALAVIRPAGSREPLTLVPESDIKVIVKTSLPGVISTRLQLENIKLPVHRRQRLGICEVFVDGVKAADIPLIAAAPLGRPTLWQRLLGWFTPGTDAP